MNQRGSTNTILLAVVIILAMALAYVLFVRKPSSPTTTEQPTVTQSTPATTPTAPSLPTTCTDEMAEGIPVITSISSYFGSVGTKIELGGCNFTGFEGDKNAWIENDQGVKGIIYGEMGSTAKLVILTLKSPLCQKDTSYSGLPCDSWLTLTPGVYKIYVTPWGNTSNIVDFTIN